ncbi:MAG TPA: OmpH family outer membrane protein [Planctomycetota bacterium]|nr:OmpH family outer membrane protein [Planctomycetota bacterium]
MRKWMVPAGCVLAGMMLSAGIVVVAAPAGILKPARIGVVDFSRLVKECEQMKEAEKSLRALQDGLAKEEAQRVEAIEALRKKLLMHVPGSAAHEGTRDEIEKKTIDYDAWRKTKLRGLADRYEDVLKGFYRDVETAAGDYATVHGLSLVIKVDKFDVDDPTLRDFRTRVALKKFVYTAADVDITSDLVAVLNARYRKAGGAK